MSLSFRFLKTLRNAKHQAQMVSLVNSTKHLKKLYQFSAISSRKQKQSGHFLTHSLRRALPQHRNWTATVQEGRLQTKICPDRGAKLFNQKLPNETQRCRKRNMHHNQGGLFQVYKTNSTFEDKYNLSRQQTKEENSFDHINIYTKYLIKSNTHL